MTALNYIEFPCTDIEACKTFYTEVFGWEWIDYGPSYAGSTSSGLEVGLNTAGQVAPAPPLGAEDGIGPLILFQTDDLDPVEAGVVAGGGTIVSPTYGYPGGHRFHFADPSGNVLGVYQSD